jgi:hypothetical protein
MKRPVLYAYAHAAGDIWWCAPFHTLLEILNRRGLMSVGKIIKWDDYLAGRYKGGVYEIPDR